MQSFEHHDHHACVADGLAQLRAQCAAKKLKLTPVRERVFELLLAQHKAQGAYDLLATLRAEGLGSQPPVIYRALDFLVSHGFAHKIEGLNAFIACAHPGEAHSPAFLICRTCARVAETEAQTPPLSSQANAAGFEIEHTVVEAMGQCSDCAEVSA